MLKLLSIPLVAVALVACTSTPAPRTMGNPAETKNSTDANRAGNPAAVSPGSGTSGSGAGGSSGSGTR